jgi:hypothetical protein
MTTVQLGHNLRAWSTFTVKDPTPEEIATLQEEDDESVALLKKLDADGRLHLESVDYEENPELFAEHADPSITNFDEEG